MHITHAKACPSIQVILFCIINNLAWQNSTAQYSFYLNFQPLHLLFLCCIKNCTTRKGCSFSIELIIICVKRFGEQLDLARKKSEVASLLCDLQNKLIRGIQRLFSVKYLFGEAKITQDFLQLEEGFKFLDEAFEAYVINSLRFT